MIIFPLSNKQGFLELVFEQLKFCIMPSVKAQFKRGLIQQMIPTISIALIYFIHHAVSERLGSQVKLYK